MRLLAESLRKMCQNQLMIETYYDHIIAVHRRSDEVKEGHRKGQHFDPFYRVTMRDQRIGFADFNLVQGRDRCLLSQLFSTEFSCSVGSQA